MKNETFDLKLRNFIEDNLTIILKKCLMIPFLRENFFHSSLFIKYVIKIACQWFKLQNCSIKICKTNHNNHYLTSPINYKKVWNLNFKIKKSYFGTVTDFIYFDIINSSHPPLTTKKSNTDNKIEFQKTLCRTENRADSTFSMTHSSR